jgi:hypothetical protein
MNDDGMGERKTSWDNRHTPCSRVGTTVRYYVLLPVVLGTFRFKDTQENLQIIPTNHLQRSTGTALD